MKPGRKKTLSLVLVAMMYLNCLTAPQAMAGSKFSASAVEKSIADYYKFYNNDGKKIVDFTDSDRDTMALAFADMIYVPQMNVKGHNEILMLMGAEYRQSPEHRHAVEDLMMKIYQMDLPQLRDLREHSALKTVVDDVFKVFTVLYIFNFGKGMLKGIRGLGALKTKNVTEMAELIKNKDIADFSQFAALLDAQRASNLKNALEIIQASKAANAAEAAELVKFSGAKSVEEISTLLRETANFPVGYDNFVKIQRLARSGGLTGLEKFKVVLRAAVLDARFGRKPLEFAKDTSKAFKAGAGVRDWVVANKATWTARSAMISIGIAHAVMQQFEEVMLDPKELLQQLQDSLLDDFTDPEDGTVHPGLATRAVNVRDEARSISIEDVKRFPEKFEKRLQELFMKLAMLKAEVEGLLASAPRLKYRVGPISDDYSEASTLISTLMMNSRRMNLNLNDDDDDAGHPSTRPSTRPSTGPTTLPTLGMETDETPMKGVWITDQELKQREEGRSKAGGSPAARPSPAPATQPSSPAPRPPEPATQSSGPATR